jgi:hypothetical protein
MEVSESVLLIQKEAGSVCLIYFTDIMTDNSYRTFNLISILFVTKSVIMINSLIHFYANVWGLGEAGEHSMSGQ